MNDAHREQAPELDLTRMIVRPQAPSFAIWWPLAALCLIALIAVPATYLLPTDAPREVAPKRTMADAPTSRVSRATTFLLDLPPSLPELSGPPVSHRLRQPVRITDRSAQVHDLPWLVTHTLEQFGHQVAADDPLHRILVRVLAEGRSDAYADAALNAALARGEFAAPVTLTTPLGEFDTPRLLIAILQVADG